MSKPKMVRLGLFREDPDNVSEATEEEINRLAGKLKRVPLGLTAMRIAYVTDDPAGGKMVISGNKRLRVLKQAYGENGEVPADWFADVTAMSAAERHEFRLNANVSDGHWNIDKLLAQYGKDELTDAGLENLLADLTVENEQSGKGKTDDDTVVEPPKVVKSKVGKIYQLGNHRLMCGDSTSADDVGLLMGENKADMIFTDPPYNVSIGDRNAAINREEKKHGQKNLGGRIEENILGDSGMTDKECGEKLWHPAFLNMRNHAQGHCCFYVTMPQGGTHMMMMMMMMKAGWNVKHELMWLKNCPTFSMGRLDYDYKHEPICYGWHRSHRFFGKGAFNKSVWEIPKPTASKDHPTMKPVELVENALLNSSLQGDVVMDLFGGSGTTIIACEKTNRVAFMMELDPKYCDVIRKRWAEYVHGKGCDWEMLTPEFNG